MKIYTISSLFVVFLLASQCKPKQQSPAAVAQSEKNIDMPHIIKAKVLSAQNQPIADAVATITDGPDTFPEIAALSDSSGYFQLATGKKAGIYTVNVYANGQNQVFKLAMPQTSGTEILKMNK